MTGVAAIRVAPDLGRVVLSRTADRDLDDLFEHIAIDNGIDRAGAILARIDEVVRLLSDAPRIGRIRADLRGSPRSFAVWPWLVIYRELERPKGVYVIRVIDGRRDLPRRI